MTAAPPRDVIVVLADQLRRDALGCYGGQDAATPNLDALAARGVRFSAASSTYPICVPFRFTLLTGQAAHTRMVPSIDWRMSPAERTLADAFGAAGYETAYVGKWHLDGGYGVRPGFSERDVALRPVGPEHRRRFDHWRGFELRNDPFDTFVFFDDDPEPRPLEGFQTDALFDLAADLVRRRDRRRPLFMMVSVEPPHPPFVAPEPYAQRWRDRPLTLPPNFAAADDRDREALLEERRAYLAVVEDLDDCVGRLVAELAAEGMDDSVVVLLADHGELGGSHGLREKQWPYEESIGIPLIVADPATSGRHGITIDTPVCTEDLFPTLLGLAGVRDETGPGRDLAPAIRGEETPSAREAVLLQFVSELRDGYPFFDATWRGVRTADAKYTVLGPADSGAPWQHFDLREDPFEMTNLLERPAARHRAQELHVLLHDLLREAGDRYELAQAP